MLLRHEHHSGQAGIEAAWACHHDHQYVASLLGSANFFNAYVVVTLSNGI